MEKILATAVAHLWAWMSEIGLVGKRVSLQESLGKGQRQEVELLVSVVQSTSLLLAGGNRVGNP